MANADGRINENSIFIVADGKLDEKAFHYYTILRINGLGRDSGNMGYLCFCKTRAGNEAFFNWITKGIVSSFENIYIPP